MYLAVQFTQLNMLEYSHYTFELIIKLKEFKKNCCFLSLPPLPTGGTLAVILGFMP